MRWLAAIALVLAPLFATAQEASPLDGLAWQWNTDGTTRSFYIESVILYDSPVQLNGKRNLEVRMGQIELKLVTSCVSLMDGKRRWEHTCTIDDIGLIGTGVTKRENMQVPKLLAEIDEELTGATVQVRQRLSGRIVGVDLQGVDKSNRELSNTHLVLRDMVRQAYSGLDLEFSKIATDNIWVQPTSRMVEFAGNHSSVAIAHRIADEGDGKAVITSFGKGSVNREISGGIATGFDMKVTGDALWDSNEGTILYRSWKVIGVQRQAIGATSPIANTGWIAVLEEGEEAPDCGGTGLWTEHAVRDTAITLMDVLLASTPT